MQFWILDFGFWISNWALGIGYWLFSSSPYPTGIQQTSPSQPPSPKRRGRSNTKISFLSLSTFRGEEWKWGQNYSSNSRMPNALFSNLRLDDNYTISIWGKILFGCLHQVSCILALNIIWVVKGGF